MKVDAVELICGYKQVLSSIIKLGNLGLCSHTFFGEGFTISIFSLSSNCHGKYRLSFFMVLRSLLKTSGLFTVQLKVLSQKLACQQKFKGRPVF
jgi:hypothetical protein